jgi:hypothetical protein
MSWSLLYGATSFSLQLEHSVPRAAGLKVDLNFELDDFQVMVDPHDRSIAINLEASTPEGPVAQPPIVVQGKFKISAATEAGRWTGTVKGKGIGKGDGGKGGDNG